MNIGNSLFEARKKSGLSQEEVAQRIGVSRQTISKWELSETIPDVYQAKKLAEIYNTTLDELITYDIDVKEIEQIIEKIDDTKSDKIDWTKVWSKKYPVLETYQTIVSTKYYEEEILKSLTKLESEYGYNRLDAMLVFKDILGKIWKYNK